MTNGLRAASIASNMGELRITMAMPTLPSASTKTLLVDAWRKALAENHEDGQMARELRKEWNERFAQARQQRLDWCAQKLQAATEENRAFRLTIRYEIDLSDDTGINHLGGIHALTTNLTPHVYTTCGVYGDHEGTRTWLPVLDSAAAHHRGTHEMSVSVTASMTQGLSAVGFGEDQGCSDTVLHDRDSNAKGMIGATGVEFLQRIGLANANNNSPETHQTGLISALSVLATHTWCSGTWTPVPARSSGFAIGPFKILDDPEYRKLVSEATSDKMSESPNTPSKGGGIRQVYLCPLFERKFLHQAANRELLPNTQIHLEPLTEQEQSISMDTEETVMVSTVGVPHRALSLMREVLALPSFRTASYTQIFLPGAYHGGVTCGAMHQCPEVSNNCFLGGAIIDSRLLPPLRSRLPYYQGGRVLQFLQARCAMRGWMLAALSLGGQDDVGNGYILDVILSLFMSLYERSHGAHGEGEL